MAHVFTAPLRWYPPVYHVYQDCPQLRRSLTVAVRVVKRSEVEASLCAHCKNRVELDVARTMEA